MKSHPNLLFRDLSNRKYFETILIIHLQVNLSLILYSYLFEFTYFSEKKFINKKSLLMRYITYIRANIIVLFFLYNRFIKKCEKDVIKLFIYMKVYSLFILFDGFYVFIFYFFGKIQCCALIHLRVIHYQLPEV